MLLCVCVGGVPSCIQEELIKWSGDSETARANQSTSSGKWCMTSAGQASSLWSVDECSINQNLLVALTQTSHNGFIAGLCKNVGSQTQLPYVLLAVSRSAHLAMFGHTMSTSAIYCRYGCQCYVPGYFDSSMPTQAPLMTQCVSYFTTSQTVIHNREREHPILFHIETTHEMLINFFVEHFYVMCF